MVAERDRWQGLYADLDAARIGTIHSLCAEILRAHPAEARVDPRFAVLEEGQINILRRRAIDETMAWAADDLAAVVLFGRLGERGLRVALDALIRQRLEALVNDIAEAELSILSNTITFTASLGVVNNDANIHELIRRADKCLYIAESEGRNRIVFEQ